MTKPNKPRERPAPTTTDGTCERPDVDFATLGIKCGQTLPCPVHDEPEEPTE